MSDARPSVRPRCGACRRGFTLLEIMLAMTLSAALVAGLWMAVTVHLKAYDSGRQEVEQAQLFRALTRRLTADVSGAASGGVSGVLPGINLTPVQPAEDAIVPGDAAPQPQQKSGLNLGLAGRGQPSRLGPVAKGPSVVAGNSTGNSTAPRSGTGPSTSAGRPTATGSTLSNANKGSPTDNSAAAIAAAAPPMVNKSVAAPLPLQLAGGSRWLEITSAPWIVPHRDDAIEDDSQRAKRCRARTVRYYVGIPGEPWMEVMEAATGAAVRGVLVRREQLPPVPQELIPGAVPLPMETPLESSAPGVPPLTQSEAPPAGPEAAPAANAAGTEGQLPETVGLTELPEVSALSFRYFDGRGWLDHWHSGEMGRLPLAIEALWATAKPWKPSGRRGRAATDEERAAYEEELASVEPFAEYFLDGPNLPPDLASENSPWQVGRAVIVVPQGQPAAPPAEWSAPDDGVLTPPADPLAPFAPALPSPTAGRLR